jgi:hypothetical protein
MYFIRKRLFPNFSFYGNWILSVDIWDNEKSADSVSNILS